MPRTMEGGVEAGRARSLVRRLPGVARVLMGIVFLASGLAGLLHLMPQPSTPLPEGAAAFFGALMKTGYMIPLIFGTQLIVGALLLANRFVPLALALLAPFVVNSVAFHAFLERSGLPLALAVLALEIYLAWSYRKAYRSMLAMRATPGAE
jgi:uncharacterized membrane protein YphA (DoxX/SURF4 family)